LNEDDAIKFLRARGFCVYRPHAKGETPGEFMQRVGISHHQVWSRLVRRWEKSHGPLHVRRRSSSGAILEFTSNAAFDAFCIASR
jgi:hypothetical protein